jgi:hypothetical protein
LNKISGIEEDFWPDRPMVQRATADAPSVLGGHREPSRMALGINYPSYQSAGYNKLFTQVWSIKSLFQVFEIVFLGLWFYLSVFFKEKPHDF